MRGIAGFAFATLFVSSARADGGLGLVLLLVPGEVGVQTGFDPMRPDHRTLPQARIAWSYQIPFCWIRPTKHDGAITYCDDGDPLVAHRAAFSFGLAFGRPELSADLRLGYRYRFSHVRTKVAPFLGLGFVGEASGDRAGVGISPELGVHFAPKTKRPALSSGFLIGLRQDTWFAEEPRLRFIGVLGWTIL